MKNNKVLPIVQGAMIVSIYGVLGIINTYTGSIFDIFISYIMLLPMMWYAYEYPLKYTFSLFISSAVVVFMSSQILFWIFSIPTLLLGISYGVLSKQKRQNIFILLVIVSAIKNSISFFIFGGLMGVSVYTEGREIYEYIISILPFLGNVISVQVSFLLLWLIIFICEAYCVLKYGNILLQRVIKKKR